PLDHAREAPALGDAGHVDVLAGLEEIDAEGGAGLEVGDRVRLHPESLHPARGLDADLLEEAELRLVQQALPLLAEADEEVHLVTAVRQLLLAQDHVGSGLHHGDRKLRSVLREDGGHADLDTEKALSANLAHFVLLERFRGWRNIDGGLVGVQRAAADHSPLPRAGQLLREGSARDSDRRGYRHVVLVATAGRSPAHGARAYPGCGRRGRKARAAPAATTEPSVLKGYVGRGRSEDAGRSPAQGARLLSGGFGFADVMVRQRPGEFRGVREGFGGDAIEQSAALRI